MITKESVIQEILDNNFKSENYSLEGVLRFLPRNIDRYGRLYGWDDEEYVIRAFLRIKNLQGFIKYLEKEI